MFPWAAAAADAILMVLSPRDFCLFIGRHYGRE
jgi:hypothetical protein